MAEQVTVKVIMQSGGAVEGFEEVAGQSVKAAEQVENMSVSVTKMGAQTETVGQELRQFYQIAGEGAERATGDMIRLREASESTRAATRQQVAGLTGARRAVNQLGFAVGDLGTSFGNLRFIMIGVANNITGVASGLARARQAAAAAGTTLSTSLMGALMGPAGLVLLVNMAVTLGLLISRLDIFGDKAEEASEKLEALKEAADEIFEFEGLGPFEELANELLPAVLSRQEDRVEMLREEKELLDDRIQSLIATGVRGASFQEQKTQELEDLKESRSILSDQLETEEGRLETIKEQRREMESQEETAERLQEILFQIGAETNPLTIDGFRQWVALLARAAGEAEETDDELGEAFEKWKRIHGLTEEQMTAEEQIRLNREAGRELLEEERKKRAEIAEEMKRMQQGLASETAGMFPEAGPIFGGEEEDLGTLAEQFGADELATLLQTDVFNSIELVEGAVDRLNQMIREAGSDKRREELRKLRDEFKELGEEMQNTTRFGDQMQTMLAQKLSSSIQQFSAALGKAVVNVEDQDFGEIFLQQVAGFAQQLGGMMITIGTGMLIAGANPIGAALGLSVSGGQLIAGGSILTALGAGASAAIGREDSRERGRQQSQSGSFRGPSEHLDSMLGANAMGREEIRRTLNLDVNRQNQQLGKKIDNVNRSIQEQTRRMDRMERIVAPIDRFDSQLLDNRGTKDKVTVSR